MNSFDVIVVGGGPGGSSAALFCSRLGLKTMLIDKSSFPRDKVCGDAISGKSMNILRKLDLLDKIEAIPQVRANGVVFSSPRGEKIRIPFRSATEGNDLHGYVSRRMDYDNFLFQTAGREAALCLEKFRITGLLQNGGRVEGIRGIPPGEKQEREYRARIVIGADGYKSFVSRTLGLYDYNSRHTLVALRAYYRNVSELSDFIEIHYVKESLPGYFWIFPLADNTANVGIGMRHYDIKKHNIDLHRVLERTIRAPKFAGRFSDAELAGKIKGWNLPVGSIFRPNHADGVMLVGDAAGLIDPFTGEGIGNAMTSAEIAARTAAAAIKEGNTGKTRLAEYDHLLKQEIAGELSLSYKLQQIGIRFPFLLNLVIGKAARSPKVAEWISAMIADEQSKKDLTSPLTYLKLLWA